jgi:hypothetical protein
MSDLLDADGDEEFYADDWPQEADEAEEEEAHAADRLTLDRFFTVDEWERGDSKSRGTIIEHCSVRFHDFEEARRPHRLLELVIERLFQRVLEGRPAPRLVGFQLRCPNMERAFYVPMRSPRQNTPRVIADALAQVCEQSGEGMDLFSGAGETKVLCSWSQRSQGECVCVYSILKSPTFAQIGVC